jgi:hypothetical protein
MDAGHIKLNFEASEWFALQEMARKYGTDVGSILRIAGVAVLEAERRGQFTIARAVGAVATPPKAELREDA